MRAADVLDGKSLLIDNLHITTISHRLMLEIDAYIEDKKYHILFHHVSSLKIGNISYPIQISGFAVADHSAAGWQPEVRYEIHDFEDDMIRFFCEDITIAD